MKLAKKTVTINGREIGPGCKPYIIAEMSGNHNGDINRAFQLLEAAKAAGADAVKLQTYTADTITIDHDGPGFVIEEGTWKGRKLYDLYQEAHTPWEWHKPLFERAKELDITIFSSPFDHTAVDFLEELNAPAYKIASFELVDIPLIRKVAATGKPVIMSTGIATLGEIEKAVNTARAAGCNELILLHCVSGYPAPAEEANLTTIRHLSEAFGAISGLSDHTLDIGVSVAAVALGASVIEKHFTLARADGGPDSTFSLESHELQSLVNNCCMAFDAIGVPDYQLKASEKLTQSSRRSLYVVKDIQKGELFSPENIRSIRPGHGLPTHHFDDIVGQRAASVISRGTPLDWMHVDR